MTRSGQVDTYRVGVRVHFAGVDTLANSKWTAKWTPLPREVDTEVDTVAKAPSGHLKWTE